MGADAHGLAALNVARYDPRMNVLETLEQVGSRLQIGFVVGTFPDDESGEIFVLFANNSAAILFGYSSGTLMNQMNVRELMSEEIASKHQEIVERHIKSTRKHSRSSVMGTWRRLDAKRRDGALVPVLANVAPVEHSGERYFVALFMDRTEYYAREEALASAVREGEDALSEADRLRGEAEQLRDEAENARRAAENGLLRQRRLSGQITLLRQIYGGTVLLVCLLGALVVGQWVTGTSDIEGIAMVERVLLVLTGILGSAMSAVFDSRSRASD
ncbi:MAG: hypothetical protein CMA63_06840 [Euryarchaeota archaeon]|nr:hypothetical protein [Euryarchaeota archaeon]|tara:strand:+ start:30073 stop:30891 length:819 start_codon:yes stop_codon:yes gene_type:complete